MPVGDAQTAFQQTAARAGIHLVRAKVPWLNQRGHLGLPDQCSAALPNLERAFQFLDGDRNEQQAKRLTPLPGDFMCPERRIMVEIDEFQHFTSHRLTTLSCIPSDFPLGYELESYIALCESQRSRADRYRASKAAKGFGPGGRSRQRAYYDLLRDLAAPSMGWQPGIRVPVLDGDGVAAFERVEAVLQAAWLLTPEEH